MSNPYEIDHNIESSDGSRNRTRRPSMTNFFAQLAQVDNTPSSHSDFHTTLAPTGIAAAERLLQDQFLFYLSITSSPTHEAFLQNLVSSLQQQVEQQSTSVQGVSQSYLDQLERVSRKALKKGEECKICGEEFLADQYSLVVQLPCHPLHRFDLDCIGPWLRLQGTCPLDRINLEDDRKKRLEDMVKSCPEDEEEDYDNMYA